MVGRNQQSKDAVRPLLQRSSGQDYISTGSGWDQRIDFKLVISSIRFPTAKLLAGLIHLKSSHFLNIFCFFFFIFYLFILFKYSAYPLPAFSPQHFGIQGHFNISKNYEKLFKIFTGLLYYKNKLLNIC